MASNNVAGCAAAARRVCLRPVQAPPAACRSASFATTSRLPHSSIKRSSCPSTSVLPRPVRSTPLPLTSVVLPARCYHSHDHPSPPGPFGAAERAILSAAYAHIPEHGFSQRTLSLGAHDAGYPDISATILPEGVFSLIRWHLETRRADLVRRRDEIYGEDGSKEAGSVGDRIERLTWERLIGNRDVIAHWQEALAVMAQPSYVPESLRQLSLLSDEVWYLSGDKSVDPSWYTKRASWAAIYAATELFMTNDRSLDFQETRAFLRRRLGAANELGGYTRSVGEWLSFAAGAGVNVLRSKGVRI